MTAWHAGGRGGEYQNGDGTTRWFWARRRSWTRGMSP